MQCGEENFGLADRLLFAIFSRSVKLKLYTDYSCLITRVRLASTPDSTSSSSSNTTTDSIRSPAPIIRVLSPDLVEMSLSASFHSLHLALPGYFQFHFLYLLTVYFHFLLE